ncbi:MAG: Periplasmic beta-glucosidase and related glycosidases [Bacteroidales bacterium]
MRKFLALLFFIACFLTGKSQTEPTLYRLADKEKMNHWADSVFDAMSYDERIGQLFIVVADPKTDSRNMRKLTQYIDSIKIGGVLFTKGDPVAQAEVTNLLQEASHVPLFISLDGEWGLSMRLSGTTRFPRNMMLGAIENDQLILEYGKEVGRQCKEMGIHINFAPLMDVNSNTKNPVIGNRSFGENPQAVADKGTAYSKGLESAGILSVAKHFPGHGDTSEDSHYMLPAVRRDREELDSVELLPFKRYIQEGYGGIMTAHLHVPALDKRADYPASLSEPVVTGLLKKEYGFNGLIFTDALAMKGASVNKTANSCVKALLAGNDILLSPANPLADFRAVKRAIDEGVLDLNEVESKCLKILRYKYIAGLNARKPIETKGLTERVNTPHAAWLAGKLNEESVTLLKNDSEILPLKQLDKRKIAVLSLGNTRENAFQEMLNKYADVAVFTLDRNTPAAQQQKVYKALEQYDVIICGVHSVRIPESESLRQLADRKKVVLSFFTLPYFCKNYKKTIDKAKAVIMAYENGSLTQEYAAQLVFGGIAAKGKLPVGIPGLYFAGAGIFTQKTRLGYCKPEEAGVNARRLSMIDSIVTEGLNAKAFPGCQVLVAKDGMIIYDKSFGYYDYDGRQPVTENAIYDLASVTKTVGTLPAVMKLFDNKGFALDSKISAFVPALTNSDKQDLIIKDLLYHQTGVVPSLFHYSRINRELVSDTKKKGFSLEVAKNYFVNDSYQDTLMKEIRLSKLSAAGKYLYSCINFVMLQKMVEHEMKQPLDSILRTEFYDRLGAGKLTYNPLKNFDTLQIVPTEYDASFRRQLLRGYVHDEVAAFQGGVSGNAGLFSNANDLAKILQLYLNLGEYGGERYLSVETMRLFTQSKSLVSRRGLGFDKPEPSNPNLSPCGKLAPASVYGHTGYTGTCFWLDPDNRLIYIFLSNRVNPTRKNNKLSSLSIRTRIQDAIYKAMK